VDITGAENTRYDICMRLISLLTLLCAPFTARAEERPKPGQPAPGFSLPASTGVTLRLADFKGKKTVVLAFFPKAFTSG
jgi:peroxiredoxin Q/BCP